jgi:hypothetical protein
MRSWRVRVHRGVDASKRSSPIPLPLVIVSALFFLWERLQPRAFQSNRVASDRG